ncbi:cell envelope integrity protein TolA [Pseudoduganella danionis]|uniref:Cell envelope integrity protein TolA n=1 Tax=Pseudoduganella danionis TaxID=1890295 RepID=A0ABW9SWZ6_9BURK|nr:cell envelope integrity protein TolA [Pseudoduganella danionis]MTW35184.1 cell envelope integrity protein TolA [Pseudoduganella danionis]
MKPAMAGGPYKVPRQSASWRAPVLAAAVHAILLMFLWVGVSWQNNTPTEVQAEIWDMKVQEAAPPAPPAPEAETEPQQEADAEPTPPPPTPVAPPQEPDIALERIKAREKLEQQQLEAARQAKLKKEAEEKLAKLEAKRLAEKKEAEQKAKLAKEQAEKDKKKTAAEKLAKEKAEKAEKAAKDKAFAAEMRRITGNAAKASTGTAERSTGGKIDGGYQAAIRAKIKSNLVYGTVDDTLSATYQITQLPTGEIIGVRKMKSSGSAAYDSAIENAIAKSSPLPKKKDGTVEREFVADFNMKDMH